MALEAPKIKRKIFNEEKCGCDVREARRLRTANNVMHERTKYIEANP